MNTHTQCLRLLKALRRKRGITSFEAFSELHITSLHRRLSDLPVLSVRDLKPGRNGNPKPNPYDSDNARVRMNGRYLPKQAQPVKNITKPSQL